MCCVSRCPGRRCSDIRFAMSKRQQTLPPAHSQTCIASAPTPTSHTPSLPPCDRTHVRPHTPARDHHRLPSPPTRRVCAMCVACCVCDSVCTVGHVPTGVMFNVILIHVEPEDMFASVCIVLIVSVIFHYLGLQDVLYPGSRSHSL